MRDRLISALAREIAPSSDFDLNPAVPLPPGRKLRAAAVLIAVDREHVWLTKRASGLKHHPGQISLPGGKVEPADQDPIAAALREAHEEIGLHPAQVEVLGILPAHETVTGFVVTPVLGLLHAPFMPTPEAGEVEEAFAVPLTHLLDPDRYAVQTRIWQQAARRYYTVPWGPYYIWGATARILRGLAQRMA